MSMIVAGHFDSKAQAEMAVKGLTDLGIQSDHIKSSFALNPMDWNAPDPFATYSGSFSRALDSLAQAPDPDRTVLARPAGIVLAIDSPFPKERLSAASVLRRCGGRNVLESERTWKEGRWVEFDPASDKRTA
jgi:hypothetical protein